MRTDPSGGGPRNPRISLMDLLHFYLLAGLVAHKVVWEVMKRHQKQPLRIRIFAGSWIVRLARLAKICILLALLAQTLLGDILPIAPHPDRLRALGVALFTVGLLVAVAARVRLGDNWTDIETAGVLEHHKLVEEGLYKYVRHPIYLGDLLLLAGFELAQNSWLVLGVLPLLPVILRQAREEEKILVANLPAYRDYCARTKRFIPFVV